MHLHIDASVYTDPFGIPMLKHTTPVHYDLDLTSLNTGKNFTVNGGQIAVHIGLELVNGDEVADIKVALFGMPVFEKTLPVLKHIGNGVQNFSVGGGQLSASGTVTVTD